MLSDWREHAACRGLNPELFTARETEHGESMPDSTVRRALSICRHCPVTEDCREFADTRKDALTVGVWGGEYRSRRLAAERQKLTGKGPLSYVHS